MTNASLLSFVPSPLPRWSIASSIATAAMVGLAACAGGSGDTASSAPATSSTPEVPSASATALGTPSTPPASSSETQDASAEVVGTVVRFSAGSTAVDLTIDEDNPAVRDFLSVLPLTLTLEEFNGWEKIAYLPRELASEGSPGSDPEDGDLIYYVPWGNLGFYYNTAGIGYSDQTIHLGTYDAPLDQLESLEGGDVSVEVVAP